jgi:hypothetical protein
MSFVEINEEFIRAFLLSSSVEFQTQPLYLEAIACCEASFVTGSRFEFAKNLHCFRYFSRRERRSKLVPLQHNFEGKLK